MGLMILWILRTVAAILGSNRGNYIWTILLCCVNILVFALVLYGMKKSSHRYKNINCSNLYLLFISDH